ncbi:SipW-dependent-type signal peptide-containing protein [Anaerosacchariphilus polymeriproducens]|uniref:SipW-cognate class signal peptide n=1 Tax=Anaerosacchariphilus polymeriproducens TaxID=1812858 RepID=A0A371B044_9FIRM|nr:SipW-dependent-type signal peptide-containing protein [Anaerosacchariphilus polymeriproducens]RDU25163.1 hypothetical protein DWV06_00610 [Anaerosacchariphilus polymeriproducens]
MKNKKLTVTAAALAATVVIALGGTLAYLSSVTNTLENKFTPGQDVKITIEEPSWDETKAKITPGADFDKDPTVIVKKETEACYVRVKVVIPNKLASIMEPLVINDKFTLDSTRTAVGSNATTYYYNYNEIVDADGTDIKLPALFTKVSIKKSAKYEDYKDFKTEDLHIDVTGQAVQSEGFVDANAAWNGFEE